MVMFYSLLYNCRLSAINYLTAVVLRPFLTCTHSEAKQSFCPLLHSFLPILMMI